MRPVDASHCLDHQLPETEASPVGLICPHCKRDLYTRTPEGPLRAFWEEQPGAYSLDGKPCWVYRLDWRDYSIRSLFPADASSECSPAYLASLAAKTAQALLRAVAPAESANATRQE